MNALLSRNRVMEAEINQLTHALQTALDENTNMAEKAIMVRVLGLVTPLLECLCNIILTWIVNLHYLCELIKEIFFFFWLMMTFLWGFSGRIVKRTNESEDGRTACTDWSNLRYFE